MQAGFRLSIICQSDSCIFPNSESQSRLRQNWRLKNESSGYKRPTFSLSRHHARCGHVSSWTPKWTQTFARTVPRLVSCLLFLVHGHDWLINILSENTELKKRNYDSIVSNELEYSPSVKYRCSVQVTMHMHFQIWLCLCVFRALINSLGCWYRCSVYDFSMQTETWGLPL